MNDTLNPRAATDQARVAYRNMTAELGHLGFDTPFQRPCAPSPRKPWLKLARSMTVPRMLSTQRATLWRKLLTWQARALFP